jgi:hypothetical protein
MHSGENSTMIEVKLSTSSPEWPILRQTPSEKGVWGNCRFFANEEVEDCDYWVVYEGLSKPEKSTCPKQNTLLITGESPTVKKYNPYFLKQFAAVITCQRSIKHPEVIYGQQALPWHVGRRQKGHVNISFTKDYDELKMITRFDKSKLISVISSDKSFTTGHRNRLQFVSKLVEHFGSNLDVFGRGVNEIEDKWDAIAPYKYHIVLENTSCQDYWTEKLSDAFLAGAYPFYYGCPNLSDYFPSAAYTAIDIDDFQGSVSAIEKTIADERYGRSISDILAARNLILDKYNLFPLVADYCSKRGSFDPKVDITIKPEIMFPSSVLSRLSLFQRLRRKPW